MDKNIVCNVGSWLNHIWTLYKVEIQKKTSQKKNKSALKDFNWLQLKSN